VPGPHRQRPRAGWYRRLMHALLPEYLKMHFENDVEAVFYDLSATLDPFVTAFGTEPSDAAVVGWYRPERPR